MNLKIACISDTHMDGMKLDGFPDADILVHAGDATYRGTEAEIMEFARNLSKHLVDSRHHKGYEKIIFVPGNHDWLFEKNETLGRQIMEHHGIVTLINEPYEYRGFNFWGSPVTPPFHNWAFNWEADKRLYLWEQIPEGTDVIITHGPPVYILDEVCDYDKIRHTGCPHLALRVRKVKPQMHVFGHIHEGFGKCVKEGITYINASFMDGRYRPDNFVMVEEIHK
jgi:Icc-related predicted phosphoesterase